MDINRIIIIIIIIKIDHLKIKRNGGVLFVMHMANPDTNRRNVIKIKRFTKTSGHNNNANGKWCSYCRSNTHTNKTCRKSNNQYSKQNYNKDVAKCLNTGKKDEENHSFDLVFSLSDDTDEEKNGTSHEKNGRHEDENGTGSHEKIQSDLTVTSGNEDIQSDVVLYNKSSDYEEIQSDLLLVDCGATAHIINDDSKFIFIDENFNPEEHYIELADGRKCNNVAKKRGTATVDIRDEDGKWRKAKLENALYVPSYPQNIFSVRAAAEKGATVQLGQNSSELITSSGLKFPIQNIGRLYYLDICKSLVSVTKRSASLEGWHRMHFMH